MGGADRADTSPGGRRVERASGRRPGPWRSASAGWRCASRTPRGTRSVRNAERKRSERVPVLSELVRTSGPDLHLLCELLDASSLPAAAREALLRSVAV